VIKNSELLGAQVPLTQAQAGYINADQQLLPVAAKLRKDIGVEGWKASYSEEKSMNKKKIIPIAVVVGRRPRCPFSIFEVFR